MHLLHPGRAIGAPSKQLRGETHVERAHYEVHRSGTHNRGYYHSCRYGSALPERVAATVDGMADTATVSAMTLLRWLRLWDFNRGYGDCYRFRHRYWVAKATDRPAIT